MIGRRLARAGAILAALTLAACGDSSDEAGSSPPAATPAPVATTAAPVATATTPIAPAPVSTAVLPAPVTTAAPAQEAPAAPPLPAVVTAAPAAAVETPPAAPVPVEAPAPTTPQATTAVVAATPAPAAAPVGGAAPVAAPPAVAAEPTAGAAAPAPPSTVVLPPEVAALVGPPPAAAAEPVASGATLDQRLAAANAAEGAVYLMQCEICHTVEQGGPARIGPNLFSIVGAPVGRDPGFTYSPAFAALRAEGAIWTPERLDAFLAAPGAAIPGTRMGFGGFDDPDTRADVIAWLGTLVPVAGEEPALPQIVGVQMPGLNPVTFVAVQADVGADQYVNLGCGACHGPDLLGGTASALAGPEFESRWFARPLIDLFAALRTMPPNDPGTLPDTRYLELLVAILVANGFEPGAAPLRNNLAALETTGFYQPVPVGRRNR